MTGFRLPIFLIIFFMLQFSYGQKTTTPSEPFHKSENGYLYVTEATELSPSKKTVFIPPQMELYKFQEKQDAFIFALLQDENTILVEFPKTRKYNTLYFFTGTNHARMRSGIEAKCVSFPLSVGTELSIAVISKDSWSVFFLSGKQSMVLNVPKDTKGIVFSKKSLYDIFVESQRKKGLTLYDGKWIDSKRADAIKKADREAQKDTETKLDLLKKMAETGYLILREGQLLRGEYRGGDKNSIFFELENGGTKTYEAEDAINASLDEAMAMVYIRKYRDIYGVALSAYKLHNYGEAAKLTEELMKQMKQTPPNTKSHGDSISKISADVEKLSNDINTSLDSLGLALYNFKTFEKDVLQKHLQAGHILFRNSVWLERSQICAGCEGKGWSGCQNCAARGDVTEICTHCEGKGSLQCPKCEGLGRYTCRNCVNGEIQVKCSKCNGRGMLKRIRPVLTNERNHPFGGENPIKIQGNNFPWGHQWGYVYEDCSRCNGVGREKEKCKECSGRGYFLCPDKVECKYCSGKGRKINKCEVCEGKRNVNCASCSGKGYTGEAQADR